MTLDLRIGRLSVSLQPIKAEPGGSFTVTGASQAEIERAVAYVTRERVDGNYYDGVYALRGELYRRLHNLSVSAAASR